MFYYMTRFCQQRNWIHGFNLCTTVYSLIFFPFTEWKKDKFLLIFPFFSSQYSTWEICRSLFIFITTSGRIIHTCRLMEEFFSSEFILWFDIDYHSEIFFMCWLAWWWIKPVCVFSQNPFPVKLPHSKSGFLEFRRYYGE